MTFTEERRNAMRRALSVDVRFLLRGTVESAGVLLDISENGLALLSDIQASEGDLIVVYPIGLGRIEGKVVRCFDGGIGVVFTATDSQKSFIRNRIASALDGKPYMRLVEKRSALRIRYNIETVAKVVGYDDHLPCTIVDMSRSGCLLRAEKIPAPGSEVTIGALRGQVSRITDDGFAIEFTALETQTRPQRVGDAA